MENNNKNANRPQDGKQNKNTPQQQKQNNKNTQGTAPQGQKKFFHHKRRHQQRNNANQNAQASAAEAVVENASLEAATNNVASSSAESQQVQKNNKKPINTQPANKQQRVPKPMNQSKPVELPNVNNILVEDAVVAEDISEVGDELDRIIMAEEASKKFRPEVIPDVIPAGKAVIVGIRFGVGGKTYYFSPGKIKCKVGEYAVVETARGIEFGEVCLSPRLIDEKLLVSPLRPIIRIATEQDIKHNLENVAKEDEAFRVCVQKIIAHKLDMKLVKAQYTFDNSKLLFYFTSAGRVDFRELVKDLAGVFHIRIELRQIGIRDEARMLGGLGTCGRPLCCSTFLSDFGQVSMKMAKEQKLSLNTSKISGCCGRLMCCLRYEYDVYAEEIKKSPSVGTFVNTPDGAGVVTEILPLAGEVKVSLRSENESAPKKYKREDVVPVSKRAPSAPSEKNANQSINDADEELDSDI